MSQAAFHFLRPSAFADSPRGSGQEALPRESPAGILEERTWVQKCFLQEEDWLLLTASPEAWGLNSMECVCTASNSRRSRGAGEAVAGAEAGKDSGASIAMKGLS